MNIFNRLFGKKAENQGQSEPGQMQETQHANETVAKENTVVEQKVQTDESTELEKDLKPPGEENPQTEEPETEKTFTNQTIPWRTFPIFISSTFSDMQAERDHLKNIVFPQVEEELQKRRIKLEIVDLRWGVDTTSMEQEDEREASVLKVCLDEIRRCRPFFIGLLGDRYGWVPPLERMKTALVGEDHIKPEKGKSVTDLEIEFGVLASREQLVRSVFYFRNPLPYETFSQKKAAMFSDEHNPELSDIEKAERKTALEKLKTNIRTHFAKKKLENKVKTYNSAWDAEKEKITSLKTWGDIVYNDILDECRSHAEDTWDKVPQNWQEQELALLDAFIEQHTHITTRINENGTTEEIPTFCGRKKLLKELKQHLLSSGNSDWGLVLTGESGSGKSAVFSMVNKMMQQEDCFVLAHSAGLSPRAKSVADLLRSWNKQLADKLDIKDNLSYDAINEEDFASRLLGEQEKETTTPIEKLQEKFRELLFTLAEKQQVVMLIDALDRFEPTARAQHLSWLPSVLPQNVRLLCTAISGTEKKAVQYHKGLTTKNIDVFSSKEAKEMLDALCARQHKSLPPKIEKIILEKKRTDGQLATTSPLWLSLAVNMLMAIDHDDFEKMSQLEGRGDQQIENYLVAMANGFDSLPGPLFLSLKTKAGILFGETFTGAVFNYIAVSRNGLREKDLENLLPADNMNWDPLRFANLRRWFKAHLVLQGEELQWNLAHSILKTALIQNIEESQLLKLHGIIAEYLLPLQNDPLKATETIYHVIHAGNNKEAALYYSSDLTEEEANGATTVLAETIYITENGLAMVQSFPGALTNNLKSFHGILKRFVYELNVSLEVEGRLTERLTILEKLQGDLELNFESNTSDEHFGYDAAALFEKLGSIHQAMGHMEEAIKYFENYNQLFLDLYEVNSQIESLQNGLAISYEKLGHIYQEIGNTKEALKFLKKRASIGEYLYKANPNNVTIKNGLAISYSKLGYIHSVIGHYAEAQNYFEKRSFLGKELYQSNPKNEALKDGLAMSYCKLGEVLQKMGHTKEALKYFEEYNKLVQELYEANPQNQAFKNSLAISYEKIGYVLQMLGNLEEALVCFEKRLSIGKELYNTNIINESFKHGLAIAYSKLGYFHKKTGHFMKGLEYFNKDILLMEELHAANHLNESITNGLSIAYENIGDIYKALGEGSEALKYYKKNFELTNALYKANPDNVEIINGYAISCSKVGDIYEELGQTNEALSFFEKDLKLTEQLNLTHPNDNSHSKILVNIYSKLGSIYKATGQIEIALKYFEKETKLKKKLFESNPMNESQKNDLAVSYSKLASIHESMNQIEKAIKYFKLFRKFNEELFKINPENIAFLERVGISYFKLSKNYKTIGSIQIGKEHFKQWKLIINQLIEKFPNENKYKDWAKGEYE